jgi:DNA-binding HxlR family transcriptional regulator
MDTRQRSKMAPFVFIGRWTPKVLFSLKERPYRHGALRRHLGSVSQRMLTRTLRHLESAGLIARRVTQSKAIAVEYSLTQMGRGNIPGSDVRVAGRGLAERCGQGAPAAV